MHRIFGGDQGHDLAGLAGLMVGVINLRHQLVIGLPQVGIFVQQQNCKDGQRQRGKDGRKAPPGAAHGKGAQGIGLLFFPGGFDGREQALARTRGRCRA